MTRMLFRISFALLFGFAPYVAASTTLPAFVWGSRNYLSSQSKDSSLQAWYQVSSGKDLATEFLGALGPSGSSVDRFLNHSALLDSSLVRVIMLGKSNRLDLAHKEGSGAIVSLIESLKKAASSLFLPDLELTHEELVGKVLSQSGLVLEIGGCKTGAQEISLQELQASLSDVHRPVSVLLCNAEAQDVLQDIELQLRGASRPFVILYAGQAEKAEASVRPVSRLLISTSPSSNAKDLCDRKCRIQVALFEVIILLILLLVALYLGLFMLHILDTPTRFEQEKKDTNRHHND